MSAAPSFIRLSYTLLSSAPLCTTPLLLTNTMHQIRIHRYLPEKLMEHIKIFWSRMNIVKLLRACEKALLWTETVYLYKEDQQVGG